MLGVETDLSKGRAPAYAAAVRSREPRRSKVTRSSACGILRASAVPPWTSCQTVRAPPSSLRAISMIDSPSFFVKSWERSHESARSSFPVTVFLAARASCSSTFFLLEERDARRRLDRGPHDDLCLGAD